MKWTRLLPLFLFLLATGGLAAAEPSVHLLWPEGAPGALGEADKDKPRLLVYLPEKEKANGSAIVICPGGGYGGLAMGHEGHEIAAWANERYGKENPNILRMHHGEIVDVGGVAAMGEAGRTKAFSSIEDYKEELEVSQQQNEQLRVALAELEARRERERLDAETGRKVREGGIKGANTPKESKP